MNTLKLIRLVVFAAATLGSSVSLACGEMMFSAGMGLPFQAYLAPRPASVLIVGNSTTDAREIYSGLGRAGHQVTYVADDAEMAQALQQTHYDIVIAAYDSVDTVTASVATSAGTTPRLLPVIQRSLRKSPEVTERFAQFLLDGASLGKYLSAINSVLDSTP